jgi:hypothetical protein
MSAATTMGEGDEMNFMKIFDWINLIVTPLVLIMYWPNLHHLGSLAFIVVPCWAGIFWLDSIQSVFEKKNIHD